MPCANLSAKLDEAVEFFQKFIYEPLQGKMAIYRKIGCVPIVGVAASDWLMFAALLTGDIVEAVSGGTSLVRHHVIMTGRDGPITYTFVQEAAAGELASWMAKPHLVFCADDDLSRVVVRRFDGAQFGDRVSECGGLSFLEGSRFSDPEVDFSAEWLKQNTDVMLVIYNAEIVAFDSRLWKVEA